MSLRKHPWPEELSVLNGAQATYRLSVPDPKTFGRFGHPARGLTFRSVAEAASAVGAQEQGCARRAFAILALVALTGLTVPRPALAIVTDDVRQNADWILSAQSADGTIANYIDKQAVWPYLSNFAAMGLVRATGVTKDPKYVAAAWRWLAWYAAHMDSNGFVTDYAMQAGRLVSTGSMDSTDAYAGTYLLALRDAYMLTKDKTKLTTLRPSIVKAVQAIEATLDTDGLTWAKPTWHVKYLMDQAEAYAGFVAARDLANVFHDTTVATRASSDASKMRSGVDRLWNASRAAYDWAAHSDGARIATDWTLLYPDALEQAWAVGFGLVDATRATTLLGRFVSTQPRWAVPDALVTFGGGGSGAVGYWPVAGLALYRVQSTSSASGVATISAAMTASKRAWPFTTGNAGQLIMYQSYALTGATTLDGLPAKSSTAQPTTTATPTPVSSATSSPSPSPTPSPTPTAVPTATPSATPAPTPTPTPSPTPILPLPTLLQLP